MKQESRCDIAIIGGSTGGVAAALAAAKAGRTIVMTEETDWIGGQLTSQGVPPDEHAYIEERGCTKSYRQFRHRIRDYYRRNLRLTKETKENDHFDPGNGCVGRLGHHPQVAVHVLEEMLAPYIHSGQLVLLKNTIIINAYTDGDKVYRVIVKNTVTRKESIISASYFLDATDCGDVLPLAGVEYVTGAESQMETGEPHALVGEPNPLDMQAVSHCFAVDYIEDGDYVIPKPKDYEYWKNYQVDYWPDKQLSWLTPHHITHEPLKWSLFGEDEGRNMFTYRRIADRDNFIPNFLQSDITIINVPQTDYFLGPVFEVENREQHLENAKQLSLSFLYWLQTEAPRPDGGTGYPGLRLRKDVMGTDDGLAKSVYIRESRRIKAEFTICEQHVSPEARGNDVAEVFGDSVGIGLYRIDLHPSTGNRNYIDINCLPFQIPLGSFIPIRVNNLIPACKNIGTTHITNGCYRLHPVEWNIGESAGYLAGYCLNRGYTPREVYYDKEKTKEFQVYLTKEGIELTW